VVKDLVMLVKITVSTREKEEAIDITPQVQKTIEASGVEEGFIIIYVPHETAAVSIHSALDEKELPKWKEMLEAIRISEKATGETKAAFVAPTEVGVIEGGKMVLGPDQRIFFYEFDGPKDRWVYLYIGK